MTKQIEVHGLDEIRQRMEMYPVKYTEEVARAVATSMLVLQENIPPYPPQPSDSTYERTGTLGRSIGITQQGGRVGQPSIFKIRRVGGMDFEGRFGTNLKYAPRVIGDRSQQSSFFSQYWWRLEQVIGPSYRKINEIFGKLTANLAKFLAGK